MNRTGLENYLKREASDAELMAIGRMWAEDNNYDHLEVWSDLHEYTEIAGWDTHELIDQLKGVNKDADYFQSDGNGNLVGLSKDEYMATIFADLDSIIDWCGDTAGFYYQQLPSAVRDFVDQDVDPIGQAHTASLTDRVQDAKNVAETQIGDVDTLNHDSGIEVGR